MDDHTRLPPHVRSMPAPNRQSTQQKGIAAAKSSNISSVQHPTHQGQSFIPEASSSSYQPRFPLHTHSIQNVGRQDRLPVTEQLTAGGFINNKTKHYDYCSYTHRLSTYRDYPVSVNRLVESFAEAGFYHTGDKDSVTCYQCGIQLKNWSRSHEPWERHTLWSSQCDYIKAIKGQQFITDIKKRGLLLSSAEPTRFPQMLQQEPALEETAFSSPPKDPTYPKYKTNESRLRTFIAASSFLFQTPKDLSEAGLFHTGVEDYTLCFQCGGGIHNWAKGDIPLVEHLRCYPDCPYVHEKMDEEIIKKFKALFKEKDELIKETDELTSHAPFHENPVTNITGINSSEATELIQRKKNICQNRLRNAREKIKTTFLSSQQQLKEKEAKNQTIQMTSNEELARQPHTENKHKVAFPLSGEHLNETPPQRQEPLPAQAAHHDAIAIQRGNSVLNDKYFCKICRVNPVAIAFTPCAHLTTCAKCSENMTECPVCKGAIKDKVKVLLPLSNRPHQAPLL